MGLKNHWKTDLYKKNDCFGSGRRATRRGSMAAFTILARTPLSKGTGFDSLLVYLDPGGGPRGEAAWQPSPFWRAPRCQRTGWVAGAPRRWSGPSWWRWGGAWAVQYHQPQPSGPRRRFRMSSLMKLQRRYRVGHKLQLLPQYDTVYNGQEIVACVITAK